VIAKSPGRANALPFSRHSPHPGIGLLSPEEWTEVAASLQLTPREWEVAVVLFEGKTRESIARHLGLATRTVRQYLERLHLKLDVSDRVGLVLQIIRVRDELAVRPSESFVEAVF